MPKESGTTKIRCANCFKSLGIGARIEIYTFLKEQGETSVNNLVNLVNLTQPTVSYHLKEMRDLGLLNSRKSGKEVYYSVNTDCPSYEDNCVLSVMKFPDKENAKNQ
jgi:DNA-binding transcriptional ArsR family regulator